MSAHASTDRELPEVSVSTADTVVLELAPSDAQTLARVLAHYDAIARWARQREADGKHGIPVVDGFEPEVWQHVLIHLSTVTIEVDADLHATIADCIAARDEGMAQAEEADRSGWNKALIDQAIDYFAATGQRFSSNDLRVLLPDDVPGPLFGARFRHAMENRGVIRCIGYTRSNKKNTHGKPVNVYVGHAQA